MSPSCRGFSAGQTRIRETRTRELLELVGLPATEFGTRSPQQLSGGQRQRVGVARAFAADPPVLLMDEPFGALDPVTRSELHHEFRRIQDQVRKTIVIVTHDMAEAFALASRIGVVADGRLVALDVPAAIARIARRRASTAAGAAARGRCRGAEAPNERAGVLAGAQRRAGGRCCGSTSSSSRFDGRRYRCGNTDRRAGGRRPRAGAPIVWLANVAQTIPSLAMFGFLLPLPFIGGLGGRVAIIVLTLYALLPIIRTTLAGMRSIDPALIEAGDGAGMTPRSGSPASSCRWRCRRSSRASVSRR